MKGLPHHPSEVALQKFQFHELRIIIKQNELPIMGKRIKMSLYTVGTLSRKGSYFKCLQNQIVYITIGDKKYQMNKGW